MRKENTSPYEGCGVGSSFKVIPTAKRMNKTPRRESSIDYTAFDLKGIRVLLCEDNDSGMINRNYKYKG